MRARKDLAVWSRAFGLDRRQARRYRRRLGQMSLDGTPCRVVVVGGYAAWVDEAWSR